MTWNMAAARARSFRVRKTPKPVGDHVFNLVVADRPTKNMILTDGFGGAYVKDGTVVRGEMPAHAACGYVHCTCDGELGAKVTRLPCGCMEMSYAEANRTFLHNVDKGDMSKLVALGIKYSDGYGRMWSNLVDRAGIVCRCAVCEMKADPERAVEQKDGSSIACLCKQFTKLYAYPIDKDCPAHANRAPARTVYDAVKSSEDFEKRSARELHELAMENREAMLHQLAQANRDTRREQIDKLRDQLVHQVAAQVAVDKIKQELDANPMLGRDYKFPVNPVAMENRQSRQFSYPPSPREQVDARVKQLRDQHGLGEQQARDMVVRGQQLDGPIIDESQFLRGIADRGDFYVFATDGVHKI